MVQEVAEEQRLALFLQADHRVQLGLGALRDDLVQECHVRRRHLHVDEKIRPIGREQQRDLFPVEQQRIEVQLAVGAMLDRDREGMRLEAIDDAADDVRGAVAEEQARQHLNLVIGLEPEWPREAAPERGKQVRQVAAEVGEAAVEPEVEDDVDQRMAQAVLARVVRAVRRRVGVDVLGRHRRTHEQATVVEIDPMQDLARDGVEERFGALGLLVVDQEAM